MKSIRFAFQILAFLGLLILMNLTVSGSDSVAAQEVTGQPHLVMPGDTWAALSLRYGVPDTILRREIGHPNRWREPAMGSELNILGATQERNGTLVRSTAGGLWALAAENGLNPWTLALQNGLNHPNQPLLSRPIILPSDQIIRDYPPGFTSLEISHMPGKSGEGMAFRGVLDEPGAPTMVSLGTEQGSLFLNLDSNRAVGLLATGAFFRPFAPELSIGVEGRPMWVQPWQFEDKTWTFNQITLTGDAANISQEAIQEERARLFELWAQQSAVPQWQAPFTEPVNSYLSYSSFYGARRSYNGGPYRTYHEGLDFAAYGGTPVYAPGAGTVVLAELLYVRGGAVIIDHGLGIYSGYYHMSNVLVEPGLVIEAGTLIGEVGTTGLSTGNHLHWDLLVNGVWIDPQTFRERDMACWILEGWGTPC